ncbi:hypothetical protein THAOC_24017 [Thalassiosira oceanica]|uniref:Uncharacterized protein n=1 Tax=Thalassiosira oceanica TaxID=159749 RepID=K0S5I9_THAOC|nr:hypothetical protein THAOC_24017 [Thalassiosira oceanica]|eukprot:EJK56151.1 hypothetical protein THAOC_24017 [Thalassiosira oceanica]
MVFYDAPQHFGPSRSADLPCFVLAKFGAQIKQTAKYGREPDANRLCYVTTTPTERRPSEDVLAHTGRCRRIECVQRYVVARSSVNRPNGRTGQNTIPGPGPRPGRPECHAALALTTGSSRSERGAARRRAL